MLNKILIVTTTLAFVALIAGIFYVYDKAKEIECYQSPMTELSDWCKNRVLHQYDLNAAYDYGAVK